MIYYTLFIVLFLNNTNQQEILIIAKYVLEHYKYIEQQGNVFALLLNILHNSLIKASLALKKSYKKYPPPIRYFYYIIFLVQVYVHYYVSPNTFFYYSYFYFFP